MTQSKRLAPVLKLEEMKEQTAIKSFSQAQAQLQDEVNRLEQLTQYSQEYQTMVEHEGRSGITAQRLQSYHHFLSRLDGAVTQQQQQVSLAQQQVEEAERQWYRQRGATQNMEGLIDRLAVAERSAADKQEQRDMDEQSALSQQWSN